MLVLELTEKMLNKLSWPNALNPRTVACVSHFIAACNLFSSDLFFRKMLIRSYLFNSIR